MQDFNYFSIFFYYIFSTTYQKIGDLFCLVIFLDFRTVCFNGVIISHLILQNEETKLKMFVKPFRVFLLKLKRSKRGKKNSLTFGVQKLSFFNLLCREAEQAK